MHIVLVYRYYNDGIVYYNLIFCTRKSLMTDLGLKCTIRHGRYTYKTWQIGWNILHFLENLPAFIVLIM